MVQDTELPDYGRIEGPNRLFGVIRCEKPIVVVIHDGENGRGFDSITLPEGTPREDVDQKVKARLKSYHAQTPRR